MRRREFIAGLGGAAAWPLVARGQQTALPVIGFLHQGAREANEHFLAEFRQGLRESGYVENQNVAIEFRWAEGHYDRLEMLVADLVRRQVAIIVVPTGLRPLQQNRQLPEFRSCLRAGVIRFKAAWLPASTIRAATSRGYT
jgi:hypothetical protein